MLPASVHAELQHRAAPEAVRAWAAAPPAWVEIRATMPPVEANDISPADRDVIALAKEVRAAILLMDDKQARRCAASFGLAAIGTVGLLEVAAMRELVSLPNALERLRGTSCFLTEDLIEHALERDAARRRT